MRHVNTLREDKLGNISNTIHPLLKATGIIFIGFVAILFYFRATFQSHFSTVVGIGYDAIIDVSIMEHWFNYFKGITQWNLVSYFAPYQDTLGYNDGYFIHGVIFSVFRACNVNIFIAKNFTLMVFVFVGYLSFYAFARYLKFSDMLSITGALLFVFSNNMQVHIVHSQLITYYLCPLFAYLTLKSLDGFLKQAPVTTMLYTACAALLLGAWLMSGYYTAWFFLYFSAIFSLVYLRLNWKSYYKTIFFSRPAIFLMIYAMVIGLIATTPFLLVYLPKLHETGGGHHLTEMQTYMPDLFSFIDVGNNNLVFGKMNQAIINYFHLENNFEQIMGFSYLFLVLACISIVKNFLHKKHLALSIAIILSIIFTLKIGDFSIWYWIYQWMPGATGVRVISRFLNVLNFPLLVLVLYYLQDIAVKRLWLFWVLSVTILLTSINTPLNGYVVNDLLAKYAAYSSPPYLCQLFYVTPRNLHFISYDDGLSLQNHNVDAMFLSEKWHIRTINGFSTFNPVFWQFSAYPLSTYKQRVYFYSKYFNILDHLCALDLSTGKWDVHPFSEAEKNQFNKNILTLPTYENFRGIEKMEDQTWRWALAPKTQISIYDFDNQAHQIKFDVDVFLPLTKRDGKSAYLVMKSPEGSKRFVFSKISDMVGKKIDVEKLLTKHIEIYLHTRPGAVTTLHFETNALGFTPLNDPDHLYFKIANVQVSLIDNKI